METTDVLVIGGSAKAAEVFAQQKTNKAAEVGTQQKTIKRLKGWPQGEEYLKGLFFKGKKYRTYLSLMKNK
jgi:hypothetical protein